MLDAKLKKKLIARLRMADLYCINFHTSCCGITFLKEEIEMLLHHMTDEIPSGKYKLVVERDGQEVRTIKNISKEYALETAYDIKAELEPTCAWHYEIKEKHKLVHLKITKKEHPYGDY